MVKYKCPNCNTVVSLGNHPMTTLSCPYCFNILIEQPSRGNPSKARLFYNSLSKEEQKIVELKETNNNNFCFIIKHNIPTEVSRWGFIKPVKLKQSYVKKYIAPLEKIMEFLESISDNKISWRFPNFDHTGTHDCEYPAFSFPTKLGIEYKLGQLFFVRQNIMMFKIGSKKDLESFAAFPIIKKALDDSARAEILYSHSRIKEAKVFLKQKQQDLKFYKKIGYEIELQNEATQDDEVQKILD